MSYGGGERKKDKGGRLPPFSLPPSLPPLPLSLPLPCLTVPDWEYAGKYFLKKSFILHTLIEHLLCAKHYCIYRGYNTAVPKQTKIPVLMKLEF